MMDGLMVKQGIEEKYFDFIAEIDDLQQEILTEVTCNGGIRDDFGYDEGMFIKLICRRFSDLRREIISSQLKDSARVVELNYAYDHDEECKISEERYNKRLNIMLRDACSKDYVLTEHGYSDIANIYGLLTYLKNYTNVAKIFNKFNDILKQISVCIHPINSTDSCYITNSDGLFVYGKDEYQRYVLGGKNSPGM
jgi:hypothetical protein